MSSVPRVMLQIGSVWARMVGQPEERRIMTLGFAIWNELVSLDPEVLMLTFGSGQFSDGCNESRRHDLGTFLIANLL